MLETGGTEVVLGSHLKKQGGGHVLWERPHSVMEAMMGRWRAVLEGCIHPPGGEGKSQERLPGEGDVWRIGRRQHLCVRVRVCAHWAWEGGGEGSRQRLPLWDGLGETQDGWGSPYWKSPSPHPLPSLSDKIRGSLGQSVTESTAGLADMGRVAKRVTVGGFFC